MSSANNPLSYSLGAGDISKIVDAILPKLSPSLPKLSKDEQYVLLHKLVLQLSKGKTFSNKEELDTLVKNIVTSIIKSILNRQIEPDDIPKPISGSSCNIICRNGGGSTQCNQFCYGTGGSGPYSYCPTNNCYQ